jgi:Ca2+-binding RTX toxin-like protein
MLHFSIILYSYYGVRRLFLGRLKGSTPSSILQQVFIVGGITMIILLLGSAMPSVTTIVIVLAYNISGTSGNDTLHGTPESDTITGFEGDDKLFGEGGDDILDGDVGSDDINGGEGIDEIKDESGESNKVYGGSANDKIDVGTAYHSTDLYYIYGDDGSDVVRVIAGHAIVNGGLGNDTIYCSANQCDISGEEGYDEIHIETVDSEAGYNADGGSGNDKLFVQPGGASIHGNDGDDYLFSGGGGFLEGDVGDDILEGLRGWTYYNGGPGADTFKCSPGSGDTVEDYNLEEGDQVSTVDCEQVNSALTNSFANVAENQYPLEYMK